MAKLTQRLKTHRFAVLALSAALLGILAGVLIGWPGKARHFDSDQNGQTIEPIIKSKTLAVRVLGSERTSLGDNSIWFVKLQNTSGRDIKAYTIASGKTWVTKNYFLGEQSLASGAVENQIIPLSSGPSHDISLGTGKEFTITAVFFADGTGDGDSRFVFMLSEKYAGMRDQANRILPCLRGLASTFGPNQESALEECEAETLRLPLKSNGRSADYEDGLESAQRELLNQLNDIKEKIRSNNLSDAANKKDKITKIFQDLARPSQ